MKKTILFLFVSLFTLQLIAQDKEYVELFFGTVKNDNAADHIKNEKATFVKMHEDRIKRGEIIGWDLWEKVSPGDTKGETVFLYVTIYSDIEKAALWNKNFNEYVKRAAGSNEAAFTKTINAVLADYTTMNNYVTSVKASDAANGHFDAKGLNDKIKYQVLNSMLVDGYRGGDYEKMEGETFKSYRKGNDKLQGWALHKVLNVYGDEKINYYTADFYASLKDIYELRENTTGYTEETIKSLKEMDKLRVLKNADIFKLVESKR
jgi:hypothetical protein